MSVVVVGCRKTPAFQPHAVPDKWFLSRRLVSGIILSKSAEPYRKSMPPPTLYISIKQQLDHQVSLLFSVERTWWSCFKNLTLNNLVNPLYSSGDPDSKTNFNFQPFSRWNVAAGVHYQMNHYYAKTQVLDLIKPRRMIKIATFAYLA